MLTGGYEWRQFGFMGAKQEAEWEIEIMSQLCKSHTCEEEDEEKIKTQQRGTAFERHCVRTISKLLAKPFRQHAVKTVLLTI